MLLLIMGFSPGYSADDLQNYLNSLSTVKTRSGDSPTDVDLSQFTSTVRKTTLKVDNLNIRFINGVLSRDASLDGPMVSIVNGSKVELGPDAVFSGSNTYLGHEVVRVEDGTFNVTQGSILEIDTQKSAAVTRSIQAIHIDYAVGLFSDKSIFKMSGGIVDGTLSCDVTNAYINLDGGTIKSISSKSYVQIFGPAEVSSIDCDNIVSIWNADAKITSIELKSGSDNSKVVLCEHLKNDINISKCYTSRNGPDGVSHSTEPTFRYVRNGDIIVSGAENAYDLTADDLAHIKYTGESYIEHDDGTWGNEYEYVIKGHEIVITPKRQEILTVDDLQAKLDEIAADGTYTRQNPCVIKLSEPIKIYKQITVPQNCHAMITGSKLIVVGDQIDADCAFVVYGSLTFKDIVFDCCNNHETSFNRYFYAKGGIFTVDENVEFINIHEESTIRLCDLAGNGELYYKSGVFTSQGMVVEGFNEGNVYISGGTIESAGTAINRASYVNLHGTGTVIGGDVVVDTKYFNISDGSTIKSNKENAILVKLTSTDGIDGGDFIGQGAKIYVREILCGRWDVKHPIIYLDANAQYRCMGLPADWQQLIDNLRNPQISEDEKLKTLIYIKMHNMKKTIAGEWANYTLNKDIVTGIESKEIFKYLLDFANMPQGLEMYYNEKNKSAQLRRLNSSSDDLQDFLNNLGGDDRGTEETPVEIPINDNVDVDKDVAFDDLQAFLDGQKEDGTFKTIAFNGGNWEIGKNTVVTLKNLNFTSTTQGGCIYVSGTLIIDININIVRFLTFVHVRPGGHVIWRTGGGSVTENVIYVEGGTLEYHNGESTGTQYGFNNIGGTVYIYGGSITGGQCGGYTHQGGTSHIIGGHVNGGMINMGTTIITGGTVGGCLSQGTGAGSWNIENGFGGTLTISGGAIGDDNGGIIGNGGNLYLDGGTYGIQDIFIQHGGCVYINFSLNVIIRIHINVTEIVLNTPIFVGFGGYKLTEDDLKNIEIILPDGYEWIYDTNVNGIMIVVSTGINDVTSGTDDDGYFYDLHGQRYNNMRKGLNIFRGKDGRLHKVMKK